MPSKENDSMVAALLQQGYADARVASAMQKVDRANFVPPEARASAYAPIPIPLGHGQTISAPTMVAHMSRLLGVQEGMRILDVGAGSGYQAAVLAELAGKSGTVITIERISELIESAKANCARSGQPGIEFIHGNGAKGYEKEAPYDRILVAAAAREIPKPLIAQLREGGRMVIPVGRPDFAELLVVHKMRGNAMRTEKVTDVMFVPLVED